MKLLVIKMSANQSRPHSSYQPNLQAQRFTPSPFNPGKFLNKNYVDTDVKMIRKEISITRKVNGPLEFERENVNG